MSAFHVPGLDRIAEIVQAKSGSTLQQVTGLKAALKELGIKPLL